MFEKIVHQIWLQGVENIPENYQKGLISINKYTPTWIHKIWDEIDILDLLRQYPEYLHVYYKLQYLHQKVDFARYVILYVYGGIYIDMDVELIKNLDKLYAECQDYDIVLSKIYTTNIIESRMMCGYNMCLNNGIIIARSNSDFMKKLIEYICNRTSCKFYEIKVTCINNTTGPKAVTRFYNCYRGNSKVKILDPEYLEPCVAGDYCQVTKNTYAVHKHTLTWFNEDLKGLFKNYLKYKYIYNIIFLVIILGIFYYLFR